MYIVNSQLINYIQQVFFKKGCEADLRFCVLGRSHKEFGAGGGGLLGVLIYFTSAVSNFSLKLRWKCTENASLGGSIFKITPYKALKATVV